jgi:hypothetical protein
MTRHNPSISISSSSSVKSPISVKHLFDLNAVLVEGGTQHPLRLYTSKIVEVPAQHVPKPYKYHTVPAGMQNYELQVNVLY